MSVSQIMQWEPDGSKLSFFNAATRAPYTLPAAATMITGTRNSLQISTTVLVFLDRSMRNVPLPPNAVIEIGPLPGANEAGR